MTTHLRNDLIAGLTVGAVTVPESMAYADLAGLPVEIGLYAALVAPLLYISSHMQADVCWPASTLSAMMAAPIAILAGEDTNRASP